MCRLALLADVDDAEEGAAWIGEDHEVSILGVLPLDTAGAQGDEAIIVLLLAVLEGTCPEGTGVPDVLDIDDQCSNAQHTFQFAPRK